ncbi:MAG: hypothetical protein V2A72_08405 [Candidatus Omnitrophota bacterium]
MRTLLKIIICISIILSPQQAQALRPISTAISSAQIFAIHKAREYDRNLLKGHLIELEDKYLPIAKEIVILAREIHKFVHQTPADKQYLILRDLQEERDMPEIIAEGKHLSNLYASAINFNKNRTSELNKKKASFLLAMEYIRDKNELYPDLSKQFNEFAQQGINLINAHLNTGKEDTQSSNYDDLGSVIKFTCKLFNLAKKKVNDLSQGRDLVFKIIDKAMRLKTPLSPDRQDEINSLRTNILGSENGKRVFLSARSLIQFYQASLFTASSNYKMAHVADVILYSLYKKTYDRNFETLIKDVKKYIGVDAAEEPSAEDISFSEFWKARQRYQQWERKHAEQEMTAEEKEKKLEQDLRTIEQMIMGQGFTLHKETYDYSSEIGAPYKNWELAQGLDIDFPNKQPDRGISNAHCTIKRKHFAIKGQKGKRFVIDLHIAKSSFTWLGKGYSVLVSIGEESDKFWEPAWKQERVFSLRIGDEFIYDKEKDTFTLVKEGLFTTMDKNTNVKIKNTRPDNPIGHIDEYMGIQDYSGPYKMDKGLYLMLEQYAPNAEIIVYGCKNDPFQFALIVDIYNDRHLILNHKGAVIYSSTEQGAINIDTFTYFIGEGHFDNEHRLQGRFFGLRKDGTKFVLNRYGIIEDEKIKNPVAFKQEWDSIHTQVLAECYRYLVKMFSGKSEFLKSEEGKLYESLKKDYANLEEERLREIILRCFAVRKEILEGQKLLEKVFFGNNKCDIGKYHYQIKPHISEWYQQYGEGYKDERISEGKLALSSALETFHVVCDYWGSEDDLYFTLCSFEYFLTDSGELKIACTDNLYDPEAMNKQYGGIDANTLKEFLAKYRLTGTLTVPVPRRLPNPSGDVYRLHRESVPFAFDASA